MSFNFRRFVITGWFLSASLCLISGIAAYISLNLQALIVFNLLFLLWVLFSIPAIILISKPKVKAWINENFPKGIWKSSELLSVIILSFIILSGTILGVPAFRLISRVSPAFADSGTLDASLKIASKIPNIEKQTLWSLAIRFEDANPKELFAKLTDKGLVFADSSQTLSQISENNQITVEGLFNILSENEKIRNLPSLEKPVGDRSLEEVCDELKISMDKAVKILADNGISAPQPSVLLKNIGSSNGFKPVQIYKILTGNEAGHQSEAGKFDNQFIQTISNWNIQLLADYLTQNQGKTVTVEEIIRRFEKNGIVIKDKNTSFGEIAEMNQIPIEKLMRMIGNPRGQAQSAQPQMKANKRRDINANKGNRQQAASKPDPDEMKRKAEQALQLSLQEIANRFRVNVNVYQKRLKEAGIESSPSQTVGEICQKSGKKPKEVFQILKGK